MKAEKPQIEQMPEWESVDVVCPSCSKPAMENDEQWWCRYCTWEEFK